MPSNSTNFDVIIVGAGPGGSGLAIRLGKQGKKVLMLDKASFPRDKTCGDGISGKSVMLLRELGIETDVANAIGAKIFGVTISSPNGQLLDIPMTGKNYGYCIRREVFDNVLFSNAEKTKNVVTIENFSVTDLIQENGFVVGIKGMDSKDKQIQEFRAKVIIGADGATSIVANKLGLGSHDPNHHIVAIRAYYDGVTELTDKIEIHFIDGVLPGYFWIFPVEKGKCNVGIGMVTKELQKRGVKLDKLMFDAIKQNDLFKTRFKNAKMAGPVKGWNLPLGSTKRKSFGNGFLLIGDAASLIDPFTGEGIGNALYSGKIAADEIEKAFKANDFSEKFFTNYSKRLDVELYPELKTSYNLQKMVNYPWLLNFLVKKAKTKPAVANFIAESLVNDKPRDKLASPLTFLKLLFA